MYMFFLPDPWWSMTTRCLLPRVQRGKRGERRQRDSARVKVAVDADLAFEQLLGLLVEIVKGGSGVPKLGGAAGTGWRELPSDDRGQPGTPRVVRRVDVEKGGFFGHIPAEFSRLDDAAIEVEVARVPEVLCGEPPAIRRGNLSKALSPAHVLLIGHPRVAEHQHPVVSQCAFDLLHDGLGNGLGKVDAFDLGAKRCVHWCAFDRGPRGGVGRKLQCARGRGDCLGDCHDDGEAKWSQVDGRGEQVCDMRTWCAPV
jgi:hypothetical protein